MTSPTEADAKTGVLTLPAVITSKVSDLFGSTAKKGVWALGDQAIVSGTNFLSTVAVGRWCELEQLGLYSLAFGVMVLLGVFQHSLILNPYAVFSSRLPASRRPRYLGSVVLQQGLFSVAGSGLLVTLAVAMSGSQNYAKFSNIALVLALAMPFFTLREFIRRILLARLNVRATFVLDSCVAAFQIAGLIALGMLNRLSAVSAYLVVAIACAVPSLVWLFLSRKAIVIRTRVAWKTIARHWVYGRWVCASQFTDVVQKYSLHWILAILVGVEATGMYTAYSSIVMIFNPFILAIGGVLLPRAAHVHHVGGVSELRRVVIKTTFIMGTVMAISCVPVAIFGDTVVDQLYQLYATESMTLLMSLLCATILVATLCIPADNGLCVLERPRISFLSGLSGLVVTILITPILAIGWGIEGAALGALISVSVAAIVQLTAFLRVTREEVRPGDAA